MGFGLPAAIGAQFGNPEAQVICISGDGGAQMNIQEMATAVCHKLPVIFCIFNNSYLGMVRQMQQLFYGKRYVGTCLRWQKDKCPDHCKGPGDQCPPYVPDFVSLAESYSALGIRVTDPKDIKLAFRDAAANKNGPTLIEFIIDTDEIVLPMVKGGNPISSMIFSPKGV